jgi:hypothetical protein
MSNDLLANPQALTRQLLNATNSLSDAEAAQRYQQILAQLPPDQAAELNALALSQVGASDRRTIAAQFRQAHQDPSSAFDGYAYNDEAEAASPLGLGQMAARAQQQDPALLGGLLGENSPLGGQIGKAALAALAALLIRRMMSGQGGSGQGLPSGGADPLGSILGGLLGAAGSGAGGQPVPQRGQPDLGGGLGDLLGGLLGGGASAQHIPQGGDLGDLLGSILGGAGATPNQAGAGSHRKEGLHVGRER